MIAEPFEDRLAALARAQVPIGNAGEQRGASLLAYQFAPPRFQFDALVVGFAPRIDLDAESGFDTAPDGSVSISPKIAGLKNPFRLGNATCDEDF